MIFDRDRLLKTGIAKYTSDFSRSSSFFLKRDWNLSFTGKRISDSYVVQIVYLKTAKLHYLTLFLQPGEAFKL